MGIITCDICPRFKDIYPGKMDKDGYHYGICGMTGNIVYPTAHKIKRMTGKGYIHCGVGSCGMFESIDDVLSHMTQSERKRWEESRK